MSGSAGTVNLILGLCSQRPVGCSDSDHECSYQRSYKPLAQLAYRFPDSRWMFHLGGELLEWIDRRHPELIMLLREMVKRRQIEPLGGGFYAPVLPVIPALDRVGQIEKLTTELRVRFGTRPRGVWLADCVWEPSLAHSLVGAGMEFTFLDSRQFRATGVAGGQLHRAHLTEDEGRVLSVMPIHHRLGELMESVSPEQAVASLCRAGDLEGNRVAVALDEPEDLGDHRWLERFLELVSADTRIVLTTPRAYLRRHGTDGFVYLDCGMDVRRSSSSRTDAASGSDRGVFRRHVSRLPDCRLLYAKMVHSYLLVNQVRGDRERRRAARNDLWRGQCGHAYWSRPAGGIRTRRTRDAVYESLLQAEVQARDQTSFLPSILRTDYDMDGHPELLYHGRQYNAYVHTAGGILFELDYLPGSVNYMNTFTRTEGPGPDRTDPYLKRGFVDHVLASAPTVADYTSGFRSAPGPVGERYVVRGRRSPHPAAPRRCHPRVGTGRWNGRLGADYPAQVLSVPRPLDGGPLRSRCGPRHRRMARRGDQPCRRRRQHRARGRAAGRATRAPATRVVRPHHPGGDRGSRRRSAADDSYRRGSGGDLCARACRRRVPVLRAGDRLEAALRGGSTVDAPGIHSVLASSLRARLVIAWRPTPILT